jgi:DNA-binding MarR family transcriptional regulator
MVAGFEIVFLLGGAFRSVITELHESLAEQGHADARPLHGFVLQAVGRDGSTIADLARTLGVSRQAAAKTAARLEELGYLARRSHPSDARAVRLVRTARAEDLLTRSAVFFEMRARQWRQAAGADAFDAAVKTLAMMAGNAQIGDLPGWLG